ncbi:hypothetical protein, partial [Shouchella clausii]|uniref:hypothetical protein n=1 Tax=Shouchella clausii TaxID=79880 RepID=UPI001C533B45
FQISSESLRLVRDSSSVTYMCTLLQPNTSDPRPSCFSLSIALLQRRRMTSSALKRKDEKNG